MKLITSYFMTLMWTIDSKTIQEMSQGDDTFTVERTVISGL